MKFGSRKFGTFAFAVIILFAVGCGNKASSDHPAAPASVSLPATIDTRPKIVAFGDSLTSGYGLTPEESYPTLLQKRLDSAGYQYEVVNQGVAGDTSAGGLRRIDWGLDGDVKVLILELGGNDILRGQPPDLMKKNLAEMIDKAKAKNIRVLLCGLYSPTSNGPDYQKQIVEAYQSLAKEEGVTFMPFFLQSVGGVDSLNQADGIHPNAAGAKIVADNVYSALEPLLQEKK